MQQQPGMGEDGEAQPEAAEVGGLGPGVACRLTRETLTAPESTRCRLGPTDVWACKHVEKHAGVHRHLRRYRCRGGHTHRGRHTLKHAPAHGPAPHPGTGTTQRKTCAKDVNGEIPIWEAGRGLDHPDHPAPLGPPHPYTHVHTRTHTHSPWQGTTYFIGTLGSRATRNQDLLLGKKEPLSAGTAFPRTRARPAPRLWAGRSGGARAEAEVGGALAGPAITPRRCLVPAAWSPESQLLPGLVWPWPQGNPQL